MHRSRFWSSRAAAALLSAAFVLSVGAPAAALSYGPIVPVSSGVDIGFGSTELAAGTGVAHVEYKTVSDSDLTPTGFIYKRSIDGGASWTGQTELVDAAHAPDTRAWGIAASGQLVVALFSRSEGNVRRLYLRRSTDAGAHWSGVQTIVSFTDTTDELGFGAVAVSGKLVVVAWSDNRTNTLRLRRSTDSGATFKPAIKIGSYTGYDGAPKVAASGKYVYITWLASYPSPEFGPPTGLKMRRSTDSGATFKPAQTLVHGTLGYGSRTSIAASGKRFVALYMAPNRVLKLARSANGGATIVTSTIASGNPTTSYRGPGSVAISGLQVRVTWEELNHAYSRASGDGGASWAAADEPFEAELEASAPRICLVGSATFVIAITSSDTTIDDKSRATS